MWELRTTLLALIFLLSRGMCGMRIWDGDSVSGHVAVISPPCKAAQDKPVPHSPAALGYGGCLTHTEQLLSVISGLSHSAHLLLGFQEGPGTAGGVHLLQHLPLRVPLEMELARSNLCSGSSSLLWTRHGISITACLITGVCPSSQRCFGNANLISCFS